MPVRREPLNKKKKSKYERADQIQNQVKMFVSVLLIILITFGLFFYMHEQETTELKQKLLKTINDRQIRLDYLNTTLHKRIGQNKAVSDFIKESVNKKRT